LTIDPAPLTVTADAKSKFTGTANPVFTGQYAGFVNGEDASVLTSPAVYTSVATVASPIGTYPIVPSGATALNYTITPVNGVLTVKAGAPTAVLFAGNTIYENQASGTLAGKLSSTSDDTQAIFTYSLVSGSGDTDNAAFRISGDQLLTTASLNYENKKVYSVLVRSTTQHGFSLDKSFTINLSDVNEIPTLDAIANLAICYTTGSQTIDLTGISSGPETGQNARITVTGSNAALLQSLTVSSASGFASGKETISYRIKNGASGISAITVTVKDNGGTDNGGVDTYSRTFVLTVNALPVVAISADKGADNNPNSTSVSKGETVVLTASGGSSYAWAVSNSAISGQNTASLTVRPRETTTYTVTVSNANGCTEQKSFTVTVLDDLEKIKATNILSPNGDGYNDKWIIDNIDFYPNNEVKIFDKSGRAVYSKKSYDNSWDGMLNGMPLSEGTYFYIIDFGKDRQKFKGFITIVREN
ncbi:gliding motility-associated C-terminal domain-containing protein, partial [Pedobacter sp. PLR]|uniref:T9SS type B sorting domain-containing protein n=1 Tax=Pedobacter sp. PLR TaxID=2994465 RepID=UPI002247615D